MSTRIPPTLQALPPHEQLTAPHPVALRALLPAILDHVERLSRLSPPRPFPEQQELWPLATFCPPPPLPLSPRLP